MTAYGTLLFPLSCGPVSLSGAWPYRSSKSAMVELRSWNGNILSLSSTVYTISFERAFRVSRRFSLRVRNISKPLRKGTMEQKESVWRLTRACFLFKR
jgi:hypothetical protein